MAKRYRLVVFDWEGTLSDPLELVLNCIAVEAKRLHLGEMDEALVRRSLELGLVSTVKKAFPHLTVMQYEALLETVQRALMTRHAEVWLVPGARELIHRLQQEGFDLAIATNRGERSLHRALQACGLEEYFRVTRSAGQVPPKPCPQMLEEILMIFSIPADEALMIGDSPTDMEMAGSAGMDAIGMNLYFQHASELLAAGALEVFDDYQAVSDYLLLGTQRTQDG